MDAGTALLLLLIACILAVDATAIAGSADALAQPREVWARAGFRRSRWVWQAFGIFVVPAAMVYSGLYFARVRPRLVAAARDVAVELEEVRVLSRPAGLPSAPQAERIRIRMALSVAGALASGPLLGATIGFGLVTLQAGFGGGTPWHLWLVWVPSAAVLTLANRTFGVTLTRRDLVMRGLSRRHVAWSDVVAVTEQSMMGSRYVQVWTRAGRSRRLRAPMTCFGIGRQRFDADFAVIEQWWLAGSATG